MLGERPWIAISARNCLCGGTIERVGMAGSGFRAGDVVTLMEHLVEAYLAKGSLETTVSEFRAGKDFDHLLATNLCVALSFLLYHTFAELDRRTRRGSIRRLLLSPRTAEGSGASVGDHAVR